MHFHVLTSSILAVFYFVPSLWIFQDTEGWLHHWKKADSLPALQQALGFMCLTTAESKTWKFLVLCEKILQAVRSMVIYWSHLYWLHVYRVSLNPWEPSAIHLLGSAGTSVPFGESLSEEQLVSASFSSPGACAWRTGPAQHCIPAWVCTSQRSPELFPVVWSCVSGISSVLIAGGEETRSLQVLKLEARSLKLLRNVEDIPTVLLLHLPPSWDSLENAELSSPFSLFSPAFKRQICSHILFRLQMPWCYCPLRSAAH